MSKNRASDEMLEILALEQPFMVKLSPNQLDEARVNLGPDVLYNPELCIAGRKIEIEILYSFIQENI